MWKEYGKLLFQKSYETKAAYCSFLMRKNGGTGRDLPKNRNNLE